MEELILSIVIVNYNSEKHLRDCLLSIEKFPPSKGDYEIIVSDNGSCDNSLELLVREFPYVKVISNDENLGFSKAANKAIRISKGKYILLLNTDTELTQGTFDLMIDLLENDPRIGVAGPMLLNRDGSIQPSVRPLPTRTHLMLGRRSLLTNLAYFRRKSARLRLIAEDIVEADLVSGGAMFIRRDAINEIGLLDERFFLYMEDVDLCRRMKEAGWKVVYNPHAKIIHHWEGTSSKQRRRAFLKHHISIYKYFQKYEPGFFRNLPLAIALVVHYLCWWVYSLFESSSPPKRIENGSWRK